MFSHEKFEAYQLSIKNWRSASEESMVHLRLWESSELVIEGCLQAIEGSKTLCFSHSEFCLAVKTLNDTGQEELFGSEPVQDKLFVIPN